MKKFSLEEAREVVEKLKKKHHYGKPSCPKWFGNACTHMNQDGSFSVSICIPAWNAMTNDEKNEFLEPFQGMHIGLRVVTPPKPYVAKIKDDPSENKGKEDVKKKKRRSNRKSYR